MDKLLQQISEIGVVPVIKLGHPTRDAAPLAKALCEGGVPVAEVTFRASGAAQAIRIMKETCPDMIVGEVDEQSYQIIQRKYDELLPEAHEILLW